jgi:hypothetical protein
MLFNFHFRFLVQYQTILTNELHLALCKTNLHAIFNTFLAAFSPLRLFIDSSHSFILSFLTNHCHYHCPSPPLFFPLSQGLLLLY